MADNSLDVMKKYYGLHGLAAREWKKKGGKVVGYICNSVPEELIMAAGMLPVRLRGNPGGETRDIIKYFGVNAHCEGFVTTLLNDLITGEYDYLDYLIIPRSRDTIATQYSRLCMLRDLDVGIRLPDLYSYEFIQTWSHNSGEYTYERLLALKAKLEEWSEKSISGRLLKDAISTTNENRRLLRQIAALRMENRISGTDSLIITGSSYFMDKNEHNRLLSVFLKQNKKIQVKTGKKIFIASSPLDNLQLYEIIESCGAVVNAEDHCWGNRGIDDMVDEVKDPIYAIAQRYHFKSPCPFVFFPENARLDYFTKKVKDTQPDGVIFYINENDAGQLWEYPDQYNFLLENNIPALSLLHQPYLINNRDELMTKVKEFVQSVPA